MIGLLFMILSLLASACWLALLFGNKNATILGLRFETLMFASVGSAVLATLFLRVGI